MLVLTSSIADVFDCSCHTDIEEHNAFAEWIEAEGERLFVDIADSDPWSPAEIAAKAKEDMEDAAYVEMEGQWS